MNLNFGHGIFAFYVVFVAALGFQVYRSTQIDHSLVADDYYAEDLEFQQILESRARADAHRVDLYQGMEGRLRLDLAAHVPAEDIRVHLQRPDARAADLTISATAPGELAHERLLSGRWNATVHYRVGEAAHVKTVNLYIR